MHAFLLGACCLVSGVVHAPSGAPVAGARVLVSGPRHFATTSDARGHFSFDVPRGRYDVAVSARGFVAVSVATGEIASNSTIDVRLEPVDSPKLRTIGRVTVNGAIALDRNVVPEMNVSRAQMDALGYQNVLESLDAVPSVVIQHPDGGAPTTPAVVSLRGPDPSEALVTLDGQALNDGNTGDVDLSDFAVPAFNGVDVTEGLGPTDSEGSNTFGGAVNFVSLQPTQLDHLNFSGSAGSYGTTQSWLNATGTIGKLGYALAGNVYQQGGQVNQYAYVYPENNVQPRNCSGPLASKATPQNCPVFTHLGSSIASRLGLVNLDYNFSQRADAGFRVFTLGDSSDESSALNGIAGNATCVQGSVPGPSCGSVNASPDASAVANPVFGQHVGAGEALFAQTIRAYDGYSRSVLGSGSLLADVYASDNNVDFTGGAVSPYDVAHQDTRYNEALSWGRTFDGSQFSFGGYTQQESLSGAGIASPASQAIHSYFMRGSQQAGSKLNLSGGLYDADYSTFGNTLNWRLGADYDLGSSSVLHASAGTGFRPPLLLERYYFPPVLVDGKLQPNPALPPEDSNCVVPGQGDPNERPEHATEYELGLSHLFSRLSSVDVSVYRSNLRDTIENFYPGGGAVSYCGKNSPNGFVYEYPINIGNAVYQGSEVRFRQQFPQQHLALALSYGLNVAYPYALGPNVSNPTSGGTLVADTQFLQIPQQQGSATLTWAAQGWHAATSLTFSGRNNALNQQPYVLTDAAVGKSFGRVDFTLAGTNVFNAVSGPFTLYDAGVPYRGLVGSGAFGNLPTNELFVQPASVQFIVTVHE